MASDANKAFKLDWKESTEYYMVRMNRNNMKKVEHFSWRIKEVITNNPSLAWWVLVDLWCADGDLLHWIKNKWFDLEYVGVDISDKMVSSAREKYGDIVFKVGDALVKNFDDDSISLYTMSSIFHEIYSYYWDGFETEWIVKCLWLLKKSLKKDGVILIKDPISPSQKNDKIRWILKDLTPKMKLSELNNVEIQSYNLVWWSIIHLDDTTVPEKFNALDCEKMSWTDRLLYDKMNFLKSYLHKIWSSLEKLLSWNIEEIEKINKIIINDISNINLHQISLEDIYLLQLISSPNILWRTLRMIRFLYEFKPARTELEDWILKISKSGEFILSRWLLSEVARHLSPGIWRTSRGRYSELMEMYWALSKNEIVSLWKSLWFEVDVQEVFEEKNHSNWLHNEIMIYDSSWNLLEQEKILPTHQYTTLRKI